MRLFLSLLLIAAFSSIYAQNKDTIGLNIPIKDDLVRYEQIINIDGKSKIDLYQNAQQWFVDYFKNSKDVIQNQDKDQGMIIGKGFITFTGKAGLGIKTNYHDKITVKITCKDNKYQYVIYDMLIYPPNYDEGYEKPLENYVGKLLGTYKMFGSKGIVRNIIQENDSQVRLLISSLKSAMQNKNDSF